MMRRSASALALAALALCGTPARAQPAVSRETIAAPLQPGAIDLPVAKGTCLLYTSPSPRDRG